MDELVSPLARSWAARSAGRMAGRVERVRSRRRRGLVMVHLDGVPRQMLDRGIATGRMPFLARAVNSGAYHLETAFWGSPASTPAFQAGLLYGHRHPNLPAYHWYDRELRKVIKMNVPKDALQIERRMGAMGNGSLLEDGGTAYLSLFRAHADNRLAMTSLADPRAMLPALWQQYQGMAGVRRRGRRQFLRAVGADTAQAIADAVRWSRRVSDGRHEWQYVLNRFFLISLGWGFAHSRALMDMVRGVPAIYLVFGNFDEVAHRRGPFSEQAARELFGVDAALEELVAMAHVVERPYDVIFLTDHGHVDSAPFEQRVGVRLGKFLLQGGPEPLDPAIERALLDGRPAAVGVLPPDEAPEVIEAGNFAHVYLTRKPAPLEAVELLGRHRDVLARAARHEAIGIVALRRGDSAVAIIGGGVYGPEEIDRAPLETEFSRRAVADLLRELPHMPTAGDLVLFGEAIKAAGTVGFAWEFGSHGGLTRTETDSVVCWPSSAPVDLSALSHATQLHQRLSSVYRN
jgi:hypothetical protein